MGGSRKKFGDKNPFPNKDPSGVGVSGTGYNPMFGGMGGQYQEFVTGGGNVNQQAANAITGGLAATADAGMYQPEDVQAGQMAGMDLSQYTNPYEQQVVDQTIADLGRANQIAGNVQDFQFGQAGAYGGSRQGIADAEMQRNFLDRVGATVGGLRQQGFTNAQNQAQADLNRQYQADTFNVGTDQFAVQNQLAAAQQAATMGNLGFDMGQTVQKNLQNQGNVDQLIAQQLIDASKGQFAGFSGAPASTIGYLSNALGAATVPTSQQNTKDLGLFDYLNMGTQVASAFAGSDIRLKENINKIGELANGIGLYTWDWNADAYEAESSLNNEGVVLGDNVGVIAQELELVHPEMVMDTKTGYKAVNYKKLDEVYS
ncbi:MAG: hypothetical protein CBC57_06740 [Euryarchaeota archaeon TMED97]|nr:MAG: hypothetical protein CBC57_06740 [Euryarchaeota archaeon TMED97]